MGKRYFSYSNTLHNGYNEDACFICEDFGFVLDGATGLSGEKVTEEKSDALWLVTKVKNYLIQNLANKSKSIAEILTSCAEHVFKEYNKILNGKNVIDAPSCCVSIFRIEQNEVVFYTLGDSPILVKLTNGKVKQFLRKDLVKFDQKTINIYKKYQRSKKCSFYDVCQEKSNIILERRVRLKNKPKGYYVFGDNIDAIKFGKIVCYDLKKVEKISIMSDGYAQIYDLFKVIKYKEIFNYINNEKDADYYYQKIIACQQEDSLLNNFPRFKLSDDSTIINIQFSDNI